MRGVQNEVMTQARKLKIVKINWLINNELSAKNLGNLQDNDWQPAPLPSHIGSGGYESWELANGITLFRSRYKFEPKVKGQLIPLALANAKFEEPTFLVQTLSQGRSIQMDSTLPHNLIYGNGFDLFRYGQSFSITPILDTTQDIEMTLVMIGRSSLVALVGEPMFDRLIEMLGLSNHPCAITREIPKFVSQPLHKCMTGEFAGYLKKLMAQAKVLEYLSQLIEYLGGKNKQKDSRTALNNRLHKLHDYLIQLEGKLPTLDVIASKFNRSARLLNDEFRASYGVSITTFILNYRLNEAHEAIKVSSIPLKQISMKLGYSHVNHFNNAFKKKFGYSPGSLRR